MKRLIVMMLIGCGNSPHPRTGSAGPSAPPPSPLRIDATRPAAAGGAKPEPLLDVMTSELARSMATLSKQDSPAYFAAYSVTDERHVYVSASNGAIESSQDYRDRKLDIDLRVGTYKLDNTHLRPDWPVLSWNPTTDLPIEDDSYAVRSILWAKTDAAYRAAASLLGASPPKENRSGTFDDFSPAPRVEYFEAIRTAPVDRSAWEKRLRDLSAVFRRYPEITMSSVSLIGGEKTRYYVNSEGTRYQVSQPGLHLQILASTDGNHRFELLNLASGQTVSDEELRKKIDALASELVSVHRPPVADSYVGPVLFEGRAAGAFIHEVLAPLVMSRRDKNESQAFASNIGRKVMPDFLDVYDDPTIASLNGQQLDGFYRYDDEGVAAVKASLVEGGVLKTMLSSRSPGVGVSRSNGHGRRSYARPPSARLGNLIVTASRTADRASLKRALLVEVRRSGNPYGIVVREVMGLASSNYNDADATFSVTPIGIFRVYLDGHEEAVRGSIKGDRVKALAGIVAAGDEIATVNGNDDVAMSVSSPSLLVRQLEVEKPTEVPVTNRRSYPPPAVEDER